MMTTSTQFLSLIAQTIFGGGLAWHVIESTWPITTRAFDNFSVKKVAAYTDNDVNRIVATEGVISNVAKIRAVIRVAQELQLITKRSGSVRKWLGNYGSHEERVAALRSLPHTGPWGAYYVLVKAGYDAPRWDDV